MAPCDCRPIHLVNFETFLYSLFVYRPISVVEFATEERQCRWWRLSFSTAEKEIILHADGKNSPSVEKTCRKDVLRLLKYDLFEFYSNNHFDDEMICSYYLKTLFLHLLEEQTDPKLWTGELLRFRYVDALSSIVSCIDKRHIEHYFIAGENILSENEIPERQLYDIKRYFLDKRRHYGSDCMN